MQSFTTRPELIGSFGMVTSTHWLASAAGMATLEKGGNAFDAAAAAGFVLQIVEPHLNGPGGEVPIILQAAGDERVRVICGQGVAPAGLTIDHILSLGLEAVPGTGLLPAVVPGAFGAWMLMLRDHGQLPLADVLEYAIGYAENGFPALPRMCASILAAEEFFRTEWPSSAEAWLKNSRTPVPNARFVSPQIAATYRRILREAQSAGSDRVRQIERARACFYEGFVAEAVDRFFRTEPVMDTSGRPHRGVLAGDDLAVWQATYEDPVSYDYAGYRVHKTGPWGQGPVFLQQLALLKGFDLAAMDPVGPDFVHTVVECAKLAFADREIFYGDPNFTEVPLETLLSDAYADERRCLVDPRCASRELRPGELDGREERLQFVLANAGRGGEGGVGSGEPTFAVLPEMRGDTVHLDVVDRWGNMVSATPSGGWLQASPTIPELGFCITTRGQMFWLDPALPSSLAPGKRPRTTLTPTLVTRDGKAIMAFGTPGGDQQDQWSVQLFLRHVHHGMNLQAAIDAPMFQTSHFPSSFYPRAMRPAHLALEGRFGAESIADLQRRGHDVEIRGDWDLGRLCAVRAKDGLLRAAATPRLMQAYAVGR
ncbi:gamma-glutamyltransferase family protein [Microvirga massiliensis]|uniref:gamma-glutamyltransferase family protein n=1 Tax=Microvirga massiliensis TaxID=1033741 RepID=UPI00062B4DC4|nr:gamma-glutamyltransferase family protein [Microvirga massiliensis]